LILKEWKGVSRKTLITVLIGILTIIASVFVVGYGNSIKG
jgi:L-rhamnose-H+ transport protein